MLNKRYIKSIKRDIFCFDFLSRILVSISFLLLLERKDKKWFKRDTIVLISFQILFVLISFLVNIGKEMSLPGFRTYPCHTLYFYHLLNACILYLVFVPWNEVC